MDKQEKYELTITADSITSTDSRFTMNDLGLGDNYKPLDVRFIKADGEEIRRKKNKGERKEIAADIVSNGYYDKYELLSPEQKKQVEFVQFHPSYDYSDFVEGLRPRLNDDGSMGFELQDGVFKRFVARARKNYEDSQKSTEMIAKEESAQEAIDSFFSSIEFGVDTFKTINGNEFTITDVTDDHIYLSIPGNAIVNKLTLNIDELRKMLESGQRFDKRREVTEFFGKKFSTQGYSYDYILFKEIIAKKKKSSKSTARPEELKKYIFIIDEINRGEISKIFGELFFSIDPGYRGESGAVSTQYANMHDDPDKKFFIPDNVYIIGTMNDIDRSVDTFDFAMRRRFRFIELKANDMVDMLADLDDEIREEAINRMANLNKAIAETEDLNENYQIGAAYFLKLKKLSFEQLWTDYLEPLLLDYVQGMYLSRNTKSVLILDNPFGKITSAHLLKPMFDIAKHFNVQMICLSDINKSDVISCFECVIKLVIKMQSLSNYEIMTHEGNERIEHGYYKIMNGQLSLFG